MSCQGQKLTYKTLSPWFYRGKHRLLVSFTAFLLLFHRGCTVIAQKIWSSFWGHLKGTYHVLLTRCNINLKDTQKVSEKFSTKHTTFIIPWCNGVFTPNAIVLALYDLRQISLLARWEMSLHIQTCPTVGVSKSLCRYRAGVEIVQLVRKTQLRQILHICCNCDNCDTRFASADLNLRLYVSLHRFCM